MTLNTGQQISGRQIIREIYRGGIGVIYLTSCDAQITPRQAAIKIARESDSKKEAEFINGRIINERTILAELKHPNIVEYYEGGTSETGLPYFLMEYIDGIRIDRYCDDNKLSLSERLRLIQLICDATDYAHSSSVIHCDIKPSNILISKDGTPKLLDFSISQIGVVSVPIGLNGGQPAVSSYISGMSEMLLTPEYAGPEQICGEPLTPAADQYNLGILLYELLTGSRPYSFDSQVYMDMANIICNVTPLEPSELIRIMSDKEVELVAECRCMNRDEMLKHLKGEVDSIVMKALSKNPDDRYKSLGELSSAILKQSI